MTRARQIVDPHQHFWKLGNIHYPWLMDEPPRDIVASNPDLTKDYLVSDLLDDARGLNLVKSVHVEGIPDPADAVAETAWLQELSDTPDNKGFPHAIVASADLRDSDFTDKTAEHAHYPNLRGVRQILNWVSDPLMRKDKWRTNFGRLGELGLIFDMQITPSQMDDAARLAADFPDVRIALNHTGLPDMASEEGFDAWRRGMTLLAPNENISVKLSGFGMLAPNCTAESIRPFVLETIDLFGVPRCMFASNFPVDRLFVSYRNLWTSYMQITEDFTDEEKSQLFCDNAVAFYRL